MKQEQYIKISPDYDVLYEDSDGCCYNAFGDEVCISEPVLGPRFSIVIPGIEEWLRRYEMATDFADTTTRADFDWRSWHHDGLCFAKAIREQLPRCYKLYYEPPYEDRSNTISKMEIDDNVDAEIRRLEEGRTKGPIPLSFKNNVIIEAKKNQDSVTARFIVGNMSTEIAMPFNRITGIRHWLKGIISSDKSCITMQLPGWNLHYFRQEIGTHTDMGEFWINKGIDFDPVFQAYVNTTDFIKALYLSLMSKLGFMLYPDIDDYPSGDERQKLWEPYNSLKSRMLESFINDGSIVSDDDNLTHSVNESFVMFPDYGGCIFWDTMGVGSGDFDELLIDSGELKIDVPGLKKWSEFYDNYDDSQTLAEYWNEGWELAKKVRKQLPGNIDLFYMCYDPSRPEAVVDYDSSLPRIIVPIEN